MKVSELWLHEWIKPELSREELCERMTMAGLEIESITPVVEPFFHVVIAKVLRVEKHPQADRLNVCEVDVGGNKPLTIVCGAKNVATGLKVPAALEGAELPNKLKITTNEIRGVTSHGMLCSATELGLAEESDGLLVLPTDAPVGEKIWEYLKLSDHIIDVSITPNRGDCLSVLGLAREISALTQTKITPPVFTKIKSNINDQLSVSIHAEEACSHYVGRIIRDVKADAATPVWMQEYLRRSGVRCISPVVDVMNYVMLELGQPMHAFDLQKISGNVQVRYAKPSETLELLNAQTVELVENTLVIADDQQPLAIAGVMGGLASAVTLLTKDIFLESAYFNPQHIARTARHFNLISESSFRFERGVDSTIQVQAIERATQLLLDIVGGKPGPVIDVTDQAYLPKVSVIPLRATRVEKILGMFIEKKEIENILTRLGFVCESTPEGWKVTVPAARPDVTLEVDLIEEVIRLYGTNRLPLRPSISALRMLPDLESRLTINRLRNMFCDLGYQEVVTYTFVDKKLQDQLNPGKEPKPLMNPITADMDVMRTNLWPGLVKTLIYNMNRQQNRIRLFETGLRFVPQEKGNYLQERVMSGLISGSALPEQWGAPTRSVDFFDLKGELETLFKLTFAKDEFEFKTGSHPALHPGQTAEVYYRNQSIGILGALHPNLIRALDLPQNVFLFEMALDEIESILVPKFSEISKFPEIRRDIAILVDQSIPAQTIRDTIISTGGDWLKEVNVFDIYQGKNVGQNRKSIALSLTLQHSSRTLIDEEVADLLERVIVVLKEKFAAELRG